MGAAGAPGTRAGRRPASSRAMLVESACELFLEQTYAGTTVEQIAQRAGVSRNTFFNYFTAKSDVLWAGVDESTQRLARQLETGDAGLSAMGSVLDALVRTAAEVSPGQIPVAITQWEAMGVAAELQASGLSRFLRMAGVIERFLLERCRPENAAPTAAGRALAQAAAFAVVAATAAAVGAWAAAGVTRAPLPGYVADAAGPVCDGFAPRLAAATR